ncbi:MAG TPA: hypothetical protein VMH81_01180 [Bryobacteraceae bacterium]|nr:hypothetical protein [Bryobacteraceae bacterium]
MPISRRSLILGSLGTLWAQDPKFSTAVDVMTVFATVHDREGRVVKSLAREEFALLDNGKPQTITYFSQESDLPLTIGLLVDTSRSQRTVLEPERNQATLSSTRFCARTKTWLSWPGSTPRSWSNRVSRVWL